MSRHGNLQNKIGNTERRNRFLNLYCCYLMGISFRWYNNVLCWKGQTKWLSECLERPRDYLENSVAPHVGAAPQIKNKSMAWGYSPESTFHSLHCSSEWSTSIFLFQITKCKMENVICCSDQHCVSSFLNMM